jgi:hypothetical protein
MGRSALVVKTAELQATVNELEATNTYSTLGELCEAIAATSWAKGVRNEKHAVRGLSAQVAGREIKARGITCKTKPGARGRAAGTVINKSSRKDKAAKLNIQKYATALRKEVAGCDRIPVPERYAKMAEQALEGNAVAAIKLQCGMCMGYTGAEKACDGGMGGVPCPLYTLNRLVYAKRRGFGPDRSGFYQLLKEAVAE